MSCRPSKGPTEKEQDCVLLIAKETSTLKRRITNVKSNTWIHVTSTQTQGFIHNILSVSHSLSFLHLFKKTRVLLYYNLLMENNGKKMIEFLNKIKHCQEFVKAK